MKRTENVLSFLYSSWDCGKWISDKSKRIMIKFMFLPVEYLGLWCSDNNNCIGDCLCVCMYVCGGGGGGGCRSSLCVLVLLLPVISWMYFCLAGEEMILRPTSHCTVVPFLQSYYSLVSKLIQARWIVNISNLSMMWFEKIIIQTNTWRLYHSMLCKQA